jgi:predicted ATPase
LIDEINLEIKKILVDLNYSEFLNERWLKNFVHDFTENGISALSEFKEKFGTKDSTLLRKLVKENKKLCKYFENKIPEETKKQVLKELKNLLLEIHYTDSMSLANEFSSDFLKRGFESIEKFKPKFGEKDTRILKQLILKNQILNEYNNSCYENIQEKTLSVMIIGATGAGKSSLINLLYLWSQGTIDLKKVNRTLIPTKYLSGLTNTESSDLTKQHQSQTQKSYVHRFKLKTEHVTYDLSIMDTPGLGDVRGVNQDDVNTENILDTVSKTAELNCIILMMNGAEARVSDRIEFIIQRLTGILPNVVRDNLIVLLSNSRLISNLDVRKYISLPEDRIFFIDNVIFSLNLKSQSVASIKNINYEFKNLKDKLSIILEMASSLKFVSTKNFLELKQKRELLKIEIDNVRRILESKLKEKSRCDELLKEIIQADNEMSDLNVNKKSIIEGIEKKKLQIDLEIKNMKAKIKHLLDDLKNICSDFNYTKELLLTKSMLESRIDYLQGEFSKTNNPNDLEEIQSAIKSKLIIGQIIQIIVDKEDDKTSFILENDNGKHELDLDTDDENDEDEAPDGDIFHF